MTATDPVPQVDIHEAKMHLSHLVDRAAAGEEIIISKSGGPKALLGPIPKPTTPRRPGRWRGRVIIHDDFDTVAAEVTAAFQGEA